MEWNGTQWNQLHSIQFNPSISHSPNLGGIQLNETCVLKFYYSTLILLASSSAQSKFSTRSFLYFFLLLISLSSSLYWVSSFSPVFSFLKDFSAQGTSFLHDLHWFYFYPIIKQLYVLFRLCVSILLWKAYLWAIYFVTECLYAMFSYVYHNISPFWAIYFANQCQIFHLF